MRRIVLFCSFLFYIAGFPLGAQSVVKVQGVVEDSLSGRPVRDAAVSVLGLQTGGYTDPNGRFTIENVYQGRYALRISHIGFQTKTVHIRVSKDFVRQLTIRLRPKTYRASPITVEGLRTLPLVQRIDHREIQNRQANTVADLLSAQPGVALVTQSASGGKGVRIRGSNRNQVLVLLDGIPLNDPLTGEVDLSLVPAGMLQSVTIRTGGGSAEYGAGAFAGVIELETRSRPLDSMQLISGLGSFGRQTVSGSLDGSRHRWDYTLSAGYQTVQNDYPYEYSLPDGTSVRAERKNADFRLRSVHASLQHEFAPGRFRLRGFLLGSRRGMPGTVFQWSPYARARDSHAGVSFSFEHQGTRSSLAIHSAFGHAVSNLHNDPPAEAPLKYRTVPSYSSRYSHQSAQGAFRYRYRLNDRALLEGDLQYRLTGFRQQQADRSSGVPGRAREYSLGPGVGGTLQFPLGGQKLLLSIRPAVRYAAVSLRHRDSRYGYPFWSYALRSALTYQGRALWSLYVDRDHSVRLPTFGDLFYQDFRVVGNPDLLPERSNETSLGLEIKPSAHATISLGGEIFRKSVMDQIIWVTGSFGNFTPTNTDAYITGQNVTLTWNGLDGRLFGSLYYQHLQALDQTSNHAYYRKYLPFRPRIRGQATLGIRFRSVRLRYHHRYSGRRYATRSNTIALPPYQVGDLTLSWELHSRTLDPISLRFGVRLENLWDAAYQVMPRMPEPGRTYLFTLSLTYHNPEHTRSSR